MSDDPRAQLRRLLVDKLRAYCPACAGVDVPGGEAGHIREPEAAYLADRLLELFATVGVTRSWPIVSNEDVDTRPYLMACTHPITEEPR